MAPQKRQPDTDIEKQLEDEFYEFSFFKAVELLERFAVGREKIGDTLEPSKETVRFSVHPGFTFPPSDIQALKPGNQDEPAKMAVAFMGLVGPSGLLPNWYNELAVKQNKNHAYTDFLDMFHHRLISLFILPGKNTGFLKIMNPAQGTVCQGIF